MALGILMPRRKMALDELEPEVIDPTQSYIGAAETGLANSQDLSVVPDVEQFPLERYEPPRGAPASIAPIITRKNANRLTGLAEQGIERGGLGWYNTDPLRNAFIEELGPVEGDYRYRRYMDVVSATSPRAKVGENIRRASELYRRDMAGLPMAGADMPPGYGTLAGKTHDYALRDIESSGLFANLDRPKTSSFAQNLQGNQRPVTVDTHNMAAMMNDGSYKQSPSKTQYRYLEDWQSELADKLGITPAQWQSSLWIGADEITGVADSRPWLEVFDSVLERTAERDKTTKSEVLKNFIRGDNNLYQMAAAVGVGGALAGGSEESEASVGSLLPRSLKRPDLEVDEMEPDIDALLDLEAEGLILDLDPDEIPPPDAGRLPDYALLPGGAYTPEQRAMEEVDPLLDLLYDDERRARAVEGGFLDPAAAAAYEEQGVLPRQLQFHSTLGTFDAFDNAYADVGTHSGSLDQAYNRLRTQGAQFDENAKIIPLLSAANNPLIDDTDYGNWKDAALVAAGLSENPALPASARAEMEQLANELADSREAIEMNGTSPDAWEFSDSNMRGHGDIRFILENEGFDSIKYPNNVEVTPELKPQFMNVIRDNRDRIDQIMEEAGAKIPRPVESDFIDPDVDYGPQEYLDARREFMGASANWEQQVKDSLTDEQRNFIEALRNQNIKISRNKENMFPIESLITLDPAKLRSPAAKFDPDRFDESNLMAFDGSGSRGNRVADVARQRATEAARSVGREFIGDLAGPSEAELGAYADIGNAAINLVDTGLRDIAGWGAGLFTGDKQLRQDIQQGSDREPSRVGQEITGMLGEALQGAQERWYDEATALMEAGAGDRLMAAEEATRGVLDRMSPEARERALSAAMLGTELIGGRGAKTAAAAVDDGAERVAKQFGDAPLPNMPMNAQGRPISQPNIPGMGVVQIGQNRQAMDAAEEYAQRTGRPYAALDEYVPVKRERAEAIAREYELMPDAPDDPEVRKAYNQMIDETLGQYDSMLTAGVEPYFIRGKDPYAASPYMALMDLAENNRLGVFPTRDGFGTDDLGNPFGIEDVDSELYPMLAETGFTLDGEPMLANDVFRAVHDYYGHAKPGVGFRAMGEENAYQSHAGMYSPLARRALATETRGQNSWLNYGPFGDNNRTAGIDDTVFAEQKMGLMPRWASEAGRRTAFERRDRFTAALRENRTGLEGAVDDDGTLRLVHRSKRDNLTRVDPAFYGQGLSGRTVADRNRRTEKGFINRSYYGIEADEDAYRGEYGLGNNKYEARIDGELMYPIQSDPESLYKGADTFSAGERRIADAGYSGYYMNHPKLRKIAVVFDPLDVTKKYVIPIAATGTAAMALDEEEPEGA